MNSKRIKGFTLIELLAVIVILAVLALIVTPVITNIISSAKEGAFKSSAYGIADAAKNYCASSMLQNGGELTDSVRFTVNNGELVASNGDKLEVKGKMPIGDSWVNITTNCGVSLSVTDGNYYATKDTDETTVTLSTVENGALTRDQLTEKYNQMQDTINSLNNEINLLKGKDTLIDSVDSEQNGKINDIINDKISMAVLWTNASPTSCFGAQTINVENLKSYQYIYITTFIGNSGFFKTTYEETMVISYADGGGYGDRYVTIKDNTITFSAGRYSYDSSKGSCVNIPYQIIGINGVN